MRNYKQISFILGVIAFLLLVTDTSTEMSIKQSFWGLLGSSEPSSVVGILDTLQLFLLTQVGNLSGYLAQLAQGAAGYMGVVYTILGYVLSLLSFIIKNSVIFYLSLAVVVYYIYTSRLFKRNDFDY
jgi:hypothetical protein